MHIQPRFPVPKLIHRHQKIEGRISVGDSAEMQLDPDLLIYLSTMPAPDLPIRGKSVHPMTGIPIGIATDAAIKAADGKVNGVCILRACTCEMLNPIPKDRSVIARGEIIALSRRHVRARATVIAEKDGTVVMSGEFVLVKVVDGKALDITDLQNHD